MRESLKRRKRENVRNDGGGEKVRRNGREKVSGKNTREKESGEKYEKKRERGERKCEEREERKKV